MVVVVLLVVVLLLLLLLLLLDWVGLEDVLAVMVVGVEVLLLDVVVDDNVDWEVEDDDDGWEVLGPLLGT